MISRIHESNNFVLVFPPDCNESPLFSSHRTRAVTHIPLHLPWNIFPLQVSQPERIISLCMDRDRLVIAMSFASCRSLSCQRITLHKNLFFSFVLNSVITIIWLTAVANNQEVVQKNPVSFWNPMSHNLVTCSNKCRDNAVMHVELQQKVCRY